MTNILGNLLRLRIEEPWFGVPWELHMMREELSWRPSLLFFVRNTFKSRFRNFFVSRNGLQYSSRFSDNIAERFHDVLRSWRWYEVWCWQAHAHFLFPRLPGITYCFSGKKISILHLCYWSQILHLQIKGHKKVFWKILIKIALPSVFLNPAIPFFDAKRTFP